MLGFLTPPIPLILFGVIEPVALIAGWLTTIRDPFPFFASQAPNHPIKKSAASFPPQALAMSLQIANLLLIIAVFLVLIFFVIKDEATKWWFLLVLCFGDYGHLYATYRAVGRGYFLDYRRWDFTASMNIGASVVFNALRWMTVLGVFDDDVKAHIVRVM